jgi:murein DD-endopeptidase MepM/ murein hydrolase activator NlpD
MSVPHHFRWFRVQSALARHGLLSACVALLILFWGLTTPAVLMQVTPQTPRLGDTVSVITQSTTPATVSVGGRTYPMFNLGNSRYRALIPTTPLDKPGKLTLKVNRDQPQEISLTLKSRSFPTQSIWLPPGQDGNVSDYEYDIVDAFKKIVSPEKFWNGKLIRPNNGPTTSGYGIRRYYNGVFAKDYYHRGVDYAGDYGSAILAPAAGRIMLIGRESQGFKVHGNCVGIDHGQGLTSIFLHLSRIDVKQGDFVQAGQKIGALGETGAATGPHLHWGLYVHGLSVDPQPWRDRGFE